MSDTSSNQISFKRNRFSTRLPAEYRYTRSHFWLVETEPGHWRIGLTNFATRMLGEIVEFDFEVKPGTEIEVGETIGWIEGFKAVSDLYCVAAGEFTGVNPEAAANQGLVGLYSHSRGWLYSVKGEPDPESLDVHGYVEYLGLTIDKMQSREKGSVKPVGGD